MLYINYKCPYNKTIETIEDVSQLTRKDWLALIKEYQKVDTNYYMSTRASRQFYQNKKDNKQC